MECGISLLAENGWMAFLAWIAFAVAATIFATLAYARRGSSGGSDPAERGGEIARLSERVDEISRRLESMERAGRPD